MAHSITIDARSQTTPRFISIPRLPGVPDAGLCYNVRTSDRLAPTTTCAFRRPACDDVCHAHGINEEIDEEGHTICCECDNYPTDLADWALPVIRRHGLLTDTPPRAYQTAGRIRQGTLPSACEMQGI